MPSSHCPRLLFCCSNPSFKGKRDICDFKESYTPSEIHPEIQDILKISEHITRSSCKDACTSKLKLVVDNKE